MFSVRVVSLDHYIAKPIDELCVNEGKLGNEWQEPVLRIFGTTADGFKTCVHIHGVYPYIYIPYKGGENPEKDALLIGAALDKALKNSLYTKISRFIRKVTLISGLPLYGYHSKHRQFFKVYFYNPFHIRKTSELLLSGAILGQKFQPHEAHIPYALQFMMDYNIYGMSFITFARVKYRRNPECPDSLVDVRREDILSDKVKKITCSYFEVDALASDIMNRIGQEATPMNPGLRAIWEDEKNRRREQNRNSDITVQQSQSRPFNDIFPIEIMYKNQLAENLRQITFEELEETAISAREDRHSDEPIHSYPAEIPEYGDFLEASALEVVDGSQSQEYVGDADGLVDQRILTQIVESQKEKAKSESEEDEIEVDSVLGRNQRAEEEAELEDEEGVDMTQPLDFDEEVICGAEGNRDEPGFSSGESEKTFWKDMADKIFQLDGAQESSSESEAEATSTGLTSGDRGSDGPLELSSVWSSNIMSILSEDSGCPTPSTICQTPRTFWSNYSPNWLPQNQDAWAWNKTGTAFSDFAGKNQSAGLNPSDFTGGPKEIVTGEQYGDFFTSNDHEYFPPSGVTPLCSSLESTISPPAILTPVSEAESSDINLDSICESFHSPLKEERSSLDSKFSEARTNFNKKPENDQQKFLQVLKTFAGKKMPSEDKCGQMTLKQYIKDCKEIVSVDFKNLCNQEMVIIEYKSQSKRSLQNKYLIKPLDKFLESWNSAERKASDTALPKDSDKPKIISGFNVDEGKNLRSVINVLEKRFSDSSTLQSVSNKLTVKSMEILPDGGSVKDRCYNINQNMISQGQIKMKLIKSQQENLEKNLVEETIKRRRSEKCLRLDLKRMKSGERNEVKEAKETRKSRRESIQKSQQIEKCRKKWKNFSEPDTKLINEINSSFEEYFKSIVQRKNFNRKKKNVIERVNSEKNDKEQMKRDDEEEISEDEKPIISPAKKVCAKDFYASPTADSIKFVTRFLSTFSRMSDMPPWSITISLGNPRASVPIQVNLQPPVTSLEKEVKYYSKKQRRKLKVENVDGPADGSSSSEESAGGHSKRRTCGEKKIKREGYYKPLNVVVYGSSSEKKANKKGRKMSSCKGFGKKEESEEKKRRESALSHSSEDPFDVCRENPKSSHFRQRKKEKNSVQSLIKRKRNQLNLKKSVAGGKTEVSEKVLPDFDQELDFIDDSDEERKRRRPGSKRGGTKCPKVIERAKHSRIPQADTEAFSSSGDEELMPISEKATRGQVLPLAEAEGTDKNMETSKKEIVCSYDNLFSKREVVNELSLEKVESTKQKSFTSDVSRQTPLASSGAQTLPLELMPADPEFGEECEIPKQGSQEAGPSSSHDCSSKNSLLTQPTVSPFTLSGSPLLASHLGSNADSSTSQISKALSPSPNTVLPFTKTCRNSGSSESAESYSRVNILGSSDDREVKSTPPIEVEAASLDWVISCKTIRPRLKPSSRKEIVETMQRSDVPESEQNTLFYGDPRDVTKAMETGPRILKIENRSLMGLKLFKSSLNILGAEERRNLFSGGLKMERYRLVGDETVSITPLMKPPSFKAVLEQLLLKSGSKDRGKEPKKAKMKIVRPVSPEQEINSDEEMNLSVTLSIPEDPKTTGLATKDSPENALKAAQSKNLSDLEVDLKKGPLSKIKGIKRFSLLKKLEAIPEEMHLPNSQGRSPPCVLTSSKENKKNSDNSFQIRGVTLDNTFGFSRSVENMQNAKPRDQHQYMSMLVIELHVQTRKDLRPDPDHDPIRALFYAITFDNPSRKQESGILVVGENFLSGSAALEHSPLYLPTEKALIEKLLALVKIWDPEILAGYEIEMHSWGYLTQRGFTLEMNIPLLLGRVKSEDFGRENSWDLQNQNDDEDDVPRSVRHMRVSGRIVLNVWRVLRHEVALTNYTFENVVYHLSHERLPRLSFERLSYYWDHPSHKFRHIVVEHYTTRVLGVGRILDRLDFINRTSELSRLFGIQFYEVLSRGSQFRVESIMLRLAKPLNYVATSPSVAQRAAMRAPASLPLILEPESLFYSDPIVVLDFQSLYPSIIIAYNYCFSTCLGRVEKLGRREPFEFGCTQLQISPEELKGLENDITISPAGVAFVKSNIRKGVLPTMLEEILEARLMVKKSMKEHKDNKVLQKVLFARQLGLKLIANVTYGYTAANFSGRMPCIEVGDSVVSKGRETLQRAIQRVKNTPKWGARVVYGDTDSIFVLTPGRSREEAFKIGAEIAEAVTQDNPKPVKLKFEKVYQPSILQTKKRYLGYMYETPDQEEPIFEAKGIETVRRDGCPAIKKVLEKALRILFDTRDVSLVKKYTIRQFSKLFQGRVNIQDLIFAREYRGRKGYRPGACVPALHLARQWTQYDKRAEPRVKERVPYVIVNGPPGVPLIRLVRSPTDLISEPSLRINAFYYITKAIIPPLQRCFSLLGADVASWLNEVPRKYQKTLKLHYSEGEKRSTISQYFPAVECVVCSEVTRAPLCQKCEKEPQALVVNLSEKVRRWERCHEGLLEICRSCCGRPTELDCTSLDCPVFFRRSQAERTLKQAPELRELLFRYL